MSDGFKNIPRKHLLIIGYLALLVSIALLIFILIDPYRLEFPAAKFVFLIIISFLISLFFFILWPHEASLKTIPAINLPVNVAGPVVIWTILFLLFMKFIPDSPPTWKYFKIESEGRVPYISSSTIKSKYNLDGKFVFKQGTLTHLDGIFIEFPIGVEKIDAQIVMPPLSPISVSIDRKQDFITIPQKLLNEN